MSRWHVHMWRPRELRGPLALGYPHPRLGRVNLGRRRYDCRCGAEKWDDDAQRMGDRVDYFKPGQVEVRGD